MIRKQEILKSFQLQQNETLIPFWELEFHLWHKFSADPFYIGSNFASLTKKEKEKAIHRNAEIISDVSHKLGFCGVTVPGGFWEVAPGVPAHYWLPDEYRFLQAELIQKYIGHDVLVIANTGGVMAMPDSDSFMDFSMQLLSYPDEIDTIAEKTFWEGEKQIDKFLEIGITTFFTASDLGDSNAPYFNPEQMERFIYPYLKRWSEYIKEAGGISILHSDGNLNPYMDNLTKCGLNAMQAIDPNAKMDIYSLLPEYSSKICLCGNLDVGLLITNSPEEIYQAVYDLLSTCTNSGSFAFGCSNAIQPEVPVENYLALVEAYNTFNPKSALENLFRL